MKGTIAESRLILLMTFLSLWPAWIRFVQFGWASNLGGLALFTAVCLWFLLEQVRNRSSSPNSPRFQYASSALIVIYIAGYHVIPPLGRGVLAMEALAFGMLACYPPEQARQRFGLAAIFPLTLPLEVALQFVLGYPLRRASAVVASLILTPYGAYAEGTVLHSQVGSLDVDTPCSGVYGLWAFLILGSLVTLIFKYGYARTIATLALAAFSGWLYNILRTCALFMYRFHFGTISETIHSSLGLMTFATVLVLFILASHYLLRRRFITSLHWRTA